MKNFTLAVMNLTWILPLISQCDGKLCSTQLTLLYRAWESPS